MFCPPKMKLSRTPMPMYRMWRGQVAQFPQFFWQPRIRAKCTAKFWQNCEQSKKNSLKFASFWPGKCHFRQSIGSIYWKNFSERYAPTHGGAPLRYCHGSKFIPMSSPPKQKTWLHQWYTVHSNLLTYLSNLSLPFSRLLASARKWNIGTWMSVNGSLDPYWQHSWSGPAIMSPRTWPDLCPLWCYGRRE